MARVIQILFKDYNNYLIPFYEIDGKKYLDLNKAHAMLTSDVKFYDESLKITYDIDENYWSVRTENMKRMELKNPQLQEFLLNKLHEYLLPETQNNSKNLFINIKIDVIDYHLPLIKIKTTDLQELNNVATTSVSNVLKLGGVELLNFYQKKVIPTLSIQTNGQWLNCSDLIIYKICSSNNMIEKLNEFLKNCQTQKIIVRGEYLEYFVEIQCTRLKNV